MRDDRLKYSITEVENTVPEGGIVSEGSPDSYSKREGSDPEDTECFWKTQGTA